MKCSLTIQLHHWRNDSSVFLCLIPCVLHIHSKVNSTLDSNIRVHHRSVLCSLYSSTLINTCTLDVES